MVLDVMIKYFIPDAAHLQYPSLRRLTLPGLNWWQLARYVFTQEFFFSALNVLHNHPLYALSILLGRAMDTP